MLNKKQELVFYMKISANLGNIIINGIIYGINLGLIINLTDFGWLKNIKIQCIAIKRIKLEILNFKSVNIQVLQA